MWNDDLANISLIRAISSTIEVIGLWQINTVNHRGHSIGGLILRNKRRIMMAKIKKLRSAIQKPLRPCDYVSKRGVEYWWASEWVRNLNGTVCRIKPIKNGDDVDLHMISKDGESSFIRGSIQKAFK